MSVREFSDWKAAARDFLNGRWPTAVGIYLLCGLLEFFLMQMIDLLIPSQSSGFSVFARWVCVTIVMIFGEVLLVGARKMILDMSEKRETRWKDLFIGFLGLSDRILWWALLMSVIDTAAMLVSTFFFLRMAGDFSLSSFFVFLFFCAAANLAAMAVRVRFAMYPYCFLESPEKSTRELFQQSSSQIKGFQVLYLLLQLSFAGMWILGILSMGIGLFWVRPYRTAVEIRFRQALVGQKKDND